MKIVLGDPRDAQSPRSEIKKARLHLSGDTFNGEWAWEFVAPDGPDEQVPRVVVFMNEAEARAQMNLLLRAFRKLKATRDE